MIYNIIDRRKRPYRWRFVYAIVEPTWHDNSVKHEHDQIDASLFRDNECDYDERIHISLHDAVIWAERLPYAATLYLYDDGTETIEFRVDGPERESRAEVIRLAQGERESIAARKN